MQFTRARRPFVLRTLGSRLPPVAPALTIPADPSDGAGWRELAGACALIATFLVMALFG